MVFKQQAVSECGAVHVVHVVHVVYVVHVVHVVHISVNLQNIVKNILLYIQQDATLHILFYLQTALRVSGGTSTHHQERIQLYLQHLVFVRPLLHPADSGR
jgi:hypothetical protein